MPANEDHNRLLTIKLNAAKRIAKDLQSYQREAGTLKHQIDAIPLESGEEQVLLRKQYVRSYDETVRMLPECRQRLEANKADIKKFISECSLSVNAELIAEAHNLLNA